MKNVRTAAVLNFLFFLIAFSVSNLSQLKLFFNVDIGEVSNAHDTVFAPAGTTFAIWGVIYASLFAFCIYHLRQAFRSKPDAEATWELEQIALLFIVNNLAATGWVFAWLEEKFVVSLLLMIVQLITLLSMNLRLDIFDRDKSLASKIFTQFPLSIYFAWICIATLANVNALLAVCGWQDQGNAGIIYAVASIAIAAVVSVSIVFFRRNVFFGLVVIWALYGIILKRNAVDPVLYREVIAASWAAIALVGSVTVFQAIRLLRKEKLF